MKKLLWVLIVILLTVGVSDAAGTWSANGFSYKPGLSTQGTTDYNAFNTSQDRVDAVLGVAPYIGGNTTISGAVTAIGSTVITLRIPPGTWPITADLVIPANVTLKFARNAILTIATTKTLTITGDIDAGCYQIFSCVGTGKVVFGTGTVKSVYPEWWQVNTTPGTTDMAVGLQAAITAGSGNTVYLQDNTTYLTSTTLSILSSTTLSMQNNTVLKAKSTLVGPVLYADTKDSVTVRGGIVDGNSAAAGTHGISLYKCTNSLLDNVYVHHATSRGFWIEGTAGVHSTNVYLRGCRVEYSSAGGATFIYVDWLKINGCQFNYNSIGITSGNSTQISIVGSSANSNTNDGFALGDGCSYAIISGCNSSNNGAEGINIDGCRYATITGNTSSNNLIGITIWNRDPGNIYAGYNIVSGNTVYNSTRYGILCADLQPGLIVSENVVTNSGYDGIYVASCPGAKVRGNSVIGSSYSGMYLVSTSDTDISGNTFKGNMRYGINLQAGSGLGRVFVDGNIIQDNGDGATYHAGLYNRASSQVWVTNNKFLDENAITKQLVAIDADTGTGCIYRNNEVYSYATSPTVSILTGKQIENTWNYQNAVPTTGTWAVGDRVIREPVVGQPKSWVCTVAGTGIGATWVSEGNL